MLQVLVARSLLLTLLLGSCWAGVGRQRRVQMSATSTRAGQAAGGFGLPLLQTTIATNDEYIETPYRPRALALSFEPQQQLQQQQQPRQLHTNIFAEEQQPSNEQSVKELQHQLLYAVPPQLEYSPQAAARHFMHKNNKESDSEKKKEHQGPAVYVFPVHLGKGDGGGGGGDKDGGDKGGSNGSTPNIQVHNKNYNNVSTVQFPLEIPAPTLPIRFLQTRYQQSPSAGAGYVGLPYSFAGFGNEPIYDNLGFVPYGGSAGYGGPTAYGGSAGYGGLSAYGGSGADYHRLAGENVPLVPITLGHNAVGYVPLNMRVLRQLMATGAAAAPTPIREGESASEELQSDIEHGDAQQDEAGADTAGSSRIQFFGQRLRPRPVAMPAAPSSYALRHPFLSMAQNLRRVQYL